MKEYLISGDFGKDTSKLLGKEKSEGSESIRKVSFKTKMYDLGKGDVEIEGNSHKVEMNGLKYIVGEQGINKSYDTSKTQLIHQLCCYTGICQYLEPDTKDNHIYMVLACPISVLQSPEAKEEFKQFMKGDGVIKVVVDDKNYEFEIKDVIIKAEGSGILYSDPATFKDNDIVLFDIGGLNLGINVYRNGVCTKEDRFAEEYGNERLIKEIQDKMSIYYKGNIIKEEEATKILDDGYALKYGSKDKKSEDYLEQAREDYFKGVLQMAKKHKINIELYNSIIFVGGTVKRITDIIRREIPNAIIPEDPQWSTVEGLYRVLFAKHGQNNKVEENGSK